VSLAVGTPVLPVRIYEAADGSIVDGRGRHSGRGYVIEPLPNEPTNITLSRFDPQTSGSISEVRNELVYSVQLLDVAAGSIVVEQYPASQLLTGALIEAIVPRVNVATFDGDAPTVALAELGAAYRGVTV
jgi:hypothetical protein